MTEPIAYLIVGLFAVGFGIAFVGLDPRSPTSRSLGLMWVLLGVGALINLPATASRDDPSATWFWQRAYSIVDPLVMIAGFEWIARIGRTEIATGEWVRRRDWWTTGGQALAVVYGLAGLCFPEIRVAVWRGGAGAWDTPGFYLFAIPYNGAFVFGLVRVVQIFRANIDRAERIRLLGFVLATPGFALSVTVGDRARPLVGALGELIFLVAAIRYHVLQGQRGQFLARFLSPEVARLVRERGVVGALERRRVEISVVACDLRNFTAFTERAEPEEVMELLDAVHRAIGEAAAAHGGSIKDFAGDGALALVGAPVPQPDHARRAVALAVELHDRIEPILVRRRSDGAALGLGVGVASGLVTVGGLGGGRLEYAAVGPAVNLASRLCARAEAGQILADAKAVALAGEEARARLVGPVDLKGLARPVTVYTIERGTK